MKILFLSILLIFSLFGANDLNSSSAIELNSTESNSTVMQPIEFNRSKIAKLIKELEEIDKDNKLLDNEWTKTYSAYITRKDLSDRKNDLEKKIKELKGLKKLSFVQKKNLNSYEKEFKVLEDKLNLVKNFDKDPFKKLIAPPELNDVPKITNPFAIIGGLSYIKDLDNKRAKYTNKYKLLSDTINNLNKKRELVQEIYNTTKGSLDKQRLDSIDNEIKQLLTIKDIFKTTKEIFLKKADEVKISIDSDIKREFEKTAYIGGIALFFIIIFLGLKFLTRKYLADKESYYTVNKVINIIFITIIVIILLFSYLENVSYLITILGFASAGIAIAMKDWFMSLMGWFVIVIGGTIHVGDRIKFVKDGVEYVGDVVDISMLRITIQEDVTLTTYMVNRRAGRFIFVPNNYVFTDMIANYSHSGLKTVWDGIDFYITFDSNVTKATNIAKNIAKQYSKGYTDITRKQLNKLRSKYQLKNTNVEPRVFSFIEGYGMKVSVWYLTNAYATLTLRSTISTKIIEEILQEEDIKIAYPTQSIYHDSGIPKPTDIENAIKEGLDNA